MKATTPTTIVRERRDHARTVQRAASVGRPDGPRASASPSAASVGMSRRLFATRIATARRPRTAPHHHAAAGTRSAITNAVPHVAISPKKRNTITSPSPRPAYGLGSAAVRERRDQRERADEQDQHRLGRRARARAPRTPPRRSTTRAATSTATRRGGARRDEPRRAEPLGRVDAPDAVEVVVRDSSRPPAARSRRAGRRRTATR